MSFLGHRPSHWAAASLIRFSCFLYFLLLLVSGVSVRHDKVHLWINGTAALWDDVDVFRIFKALMMDTGNDKIKHFTYTALPHTAPKFDDRDSYPLKSDGIGLDVDIIFRDLDKNASDILDALVASDLRELNKLVSAIFKRPVRAFRNLPTTELFIANATIGINQPVEVWKIYLNTSKSSIRKESVFQVPGEVLKYMPTDLQDALHANQSHYQIMPTSMWTNSTGGYINYTVYAAPSDKIPADMQLTREEVYDRLLGSTLPRFGKELDYLIENNNKFSELRGLLWQPVILRAYLPPSPNPTPPSGLVVVSNATARFVIHFSGGEAGWRGVVAANSSALRDAIRTAAAAALGRRLYVTEVSVGRLQPAEGAAGLLAYGEATQGRAAAARHPWDARDIASVLSQGDYGTALALYAEIGGSAPAKLIAVSLDADFGAVSTTHSMVLICIVAITLGLTVLLLVIFVVHLCLRVSQKKKVGELTEDSSDGFSNPSCTPGAPLWNLDRPAATSSDLADSARVCTPLSAQLEGRQLRRRHPSVIIANPLRTTDNTAAELRVASEAPPISF